MKKKIAFWDKKRDIKGTETMKEPVYTNFSESEKLTISQMKERNIHFYASLTSYRGLLKDIPIEKQDKRHILKSLLESNSTYLVVGTDTRDMDSTIVFGKVDLAKALIPLKFNYGITYIDYDDYLLALTLYLEKPISAFKGSNEIDIFLSYDDMEKLVNGITMDVNMKNNWAEIKHWWTQKGLFKDLD
jgi:hypothetical protein